VESRVRTQAVLIRKRTYTIAFKLPHLFSESYYENLCIIHVKLLHGISSSKVTMYLKIANIRCSEVGRHL
jgi:hypothetical protein